MCVVCGGIARRPLPACAHLLGEPRREAARLRAVRADPRAPKNLHPVGLDPTVDPRRKRAENW